MILLNDIIDRIRLPFRKDKELYLALRDIIGFIPHEISYYKLALMHKSVGHRGPIDPKVTDTSRYNKAEAKAIKAKMKNAKGKQNTAKKLNNERLEFLGDAILDAVVGDIVYCHFQGKPEGFLTNTRSKLVQRETLGKLAQEIGLNRLILSAGRSASHNSFMGGNAFEALVGAIYLDRGYDACMKFMQQRILGKYINIDKVAYKEVNFKSKLIEWTQKNRIQLSFRLEDQTKDKSGSPIFKYTVVLETVDGYTGTGFSKKEAQQLACKDTLKRLHNDSAFLDSVFAAKTERTKMEEEPATVAPDPEKTEPDFIITGGESQPKEADNAPVAEIEATESNAVTPPSEDNSNVVALEKAIDSEMDLSDITAQPKPMTREEIIDAAEEAAFSESNS